MQPNERRRKIIDSLSFRRHDTMQHLADEFGVSWDTIHKDIQLLSEEYPLITTRGYGGGISLPDGYYVSQKHLSPKQAEAIRRNLSIVCESDRKVFESILTDFAWQLQ